jgi:hypothetical protein
MLRASPAEGDHVQDTRVRERPGGARRPSGQGVFGPDSLIWLVGVSVLFLASELLPALLRLPLGADEITYIARSSVHHSAVFLPPVHGHGAGLLAAPVTLVTTSLTAIRVWMAVLSGLALFLSLLCWRGLRPAWVLAVAGFIFGALAITELSGVQVYPDLWAGFGALAITGLLLQALQDRMRPQVVLPLIAFVAFVIVLMRPQNIVFVLAPTFVAPLVVRAWRKPGVLVAMIVGMAAGVLEWVAEAYLWFGGLFSRIHLAGQEPPTFGLHFSLAMQIKTLSGPWYCDPTTTPACHVGYAYPVVYLWWLAFFALVAVGLFAAWRSPARPSTLLALVTGGWVAVLYIFLVPFGAPRYFLPTWALFAIVAADGIAWLATVPKWKMAGAVLAGVFLVSWAVSQHVVLTGETAGAAALRPFVAKAEALKKLGVKPPCAIANSPSVAYYLGCTSPWTGGTIREVLKHTAGGLKGWHRVSLPPGSPYKYIWVKR